MVTAEKIVKKHLKRGAPYGIALKRAIDESVDIGTVSRYSCLHCVKSHLTALYTIALVNKDSCNKRGRFT